MAPRSEFWYCLCYWLGIPFHSISYSRPVCHKPADPYGNHQVGCGGNADRIARHNAIWEILAQAIALTPTQEALGLVANSQVQPADIFLPNWYGSHPTSIDVHVISPMQDLTLTNATTTPGHAFQIGVQRKLTSNLPHCRVAGINFVLFVMKSLGASVQMLSLSCIL